MMCDVVTFGEAMIRLSPSHFQRLEQATGLDLYVGGAELRDRKDRLLYRLKWVQRPPEITKRGWMHGL